MIHRAFRVALVLTLTTLAPLASRAEDATPPGAATPGAAMPAPAAAMPSAPEPASAAPAATAAPAAPAPTMPASTAVAPAPEAPAAAAAPAPVAPAPTAAAPSAAEPTTAATPAAPAPAAMPAPATAATPSAPAPTAAAPSPAAPSATPSAPATAATPAAPAPAATKPTATATAPEPEPAGAAELNAVARLLAGLPPAPNSAVAPLATSREWQHYAKSLDTVFGRVEKQQLTKIRAWSARNLPESRPTLLYMFSGPDFLYASAFFPKVKTYVLAGLEPVGPVPDPLKLGRRFGMGLGQIQTSLSSILNYSFFRTIDMQKQLRTGYFDGTLPVLYVFLARTGNTLLSVEPVKIDLEGVVHPDDGKGEPGTTFGAKITFKNPDGEPKTLYYFSTNLANAGVQKSGFLKFCETLTPADAFIKSASYLLHDGNFAKVREFLLANSTAIIQDDSGIPLGYFDRKMWELRPFGRYAGPIPLFSGLYQRSYAQLFKDSKALDFGIGYRWRANESNLLLAIKSSSTSAQTEK